MVRRGWGNILLGLLKCRHFFLSHWDDLPAVRENQANRVRKAETNIKCWIAASRGPGFWSYLVLWEVSDQKQSQVTLVFRSITYCLMAVSQFPHDKMETIISDLSYLGFFFFFFGSLAKWSSKFICFLTLIGISFFIFLLFAARKWTQNLWLSGTSVLSSNINNRKESLSTSSIPGSVLNTSLIYWTKTKSQPRKAE